MAEEIKDEVRDRLATDLGARSIAEEMAEEDQESLNASSSASMPSQSSSSNSALSIVSLQASTSSSTPALATTVSEVKLVASPFFSAPAAQQKATELSQEQKKLADEIKGCLARPDSHRCLSQFIEKQQRKDKTFKPISLKPIINTLYHVDGSATRSTLFLFSVIQKHHINYIAVQKLVNEFGADINQADEKGNTPLMLALSPSVDDFNSKEIVEFLYKKDPILDAKNKEGLMASDYLTKRSLELQYQLCGFVSKDLSFIAKINMDFNAKNNKIEMTI